MSRFCRYSRISPLELCLEHERRAWRCAAVLLLLLPALALGALFCPAPARVVAGQGSPFFSGIVVEEVVDAPQVQPVPPLPAAPVPELLPEVPASIARPEVQTLTPPEWETGEWEPAEPLLALELPELPARAEKPRQRAGARPALPASSAPVAAGGGSAGEIVAARYRSTPKPPYPPSLLNRRVQGRVGLRVSVDAEGVPQLVEVCAPSGYAAFDHCAREWVLAHWRFHPARRGGVPVASIVRTQVDFVLH